MKKLGLIVTVSLEAVFVIWSVFDLFRAKQDDFTDHTLAIILFGGITSLILLVYNALFCLCKTGGKIAYGFGCVSVILASLFILIIVKKVDSERHQWFLERGIREYDDYVHLIEQNRNILSRKMVNVGKTLTPVPWGKSEIMAATNSDGSLFVMFIRRGNDPWSGYVYYSGKKLTQQGVASDIYVLDDSDKHFRKLMDKWFEY